jgi:hypothetical protein
MMDIEKEKIEMAWDPNTPPTVLERLSKDLEADVLYGVAGNRNSTPEILSRLANYSDWTVKCQVARNPNCPKEVLIQLMQDADSYVRKIALGRI